MFSSPYFIALVLPVAFAILQNFINGLAISEHRDGERKYRIWYLDKGARYKLSPLDFRQLQSELSAGQKPISDVDELPGGFWETSFGIDLCVGAISTDLVNGLLLLNLPHEALLVLLPRVFYLFILEFFMAVAIANFFREWRGHPNRTVRMLVIQGTNLLGLSAMFLSFLLLGSLVLYG
jgi:hypothetical protein